MQIKTYGHIKPLLGAKYKMTGRRAITYAEPGLLSEDGVLRASMPGE